MAPYYRKFHTLNLPSKANSSHLGTDWSYEKVRGTTEPIQASFPLGSEDPLSKAWIQTFEKMDYSVRCNPFIGKVIGGYSNPSSIDPHTKTRSYACPAYYVPASHRPNLTVITSATVNRILSTSKDTDNFIATGVQVTVEGKTHNFKARKEVILAAGAFQSPKLLELSGIGKADLLKSHHIPVLIDNPKVGENLQDHLMVAISYEVLDGTPTADALLRQEPEATKAATDQYVQHKTGPLSYGAFGSHSFMPLTEDLLPKGRRELWQIFADYEPSLTERFAYEFVDNIITSPYEASACLFLFAGQANMHDDKGEKGGKNYLQMPKAGNYLSLAATLSHPLSRGNVHITSSDVNDPPRIDCKYLSHPLDIEVLARHVLSLDTLATKEPLASFIKPGGRRNHETAYMTSLDVAKDYTRTTAISNNHPSCTCSMKPRRKGGVVDERLLVHGTTNLRIVDSSIMPLIPRGNIQTTVYAVAERAADLIKEDSA